MNYFLMPDYYKDFSCKKGDCRSSCCKGWKVTFSLKDYFKLVSEECSEELRNRLDKGVKISLKPTPDAYAEIQHDFIGNCPMLLSDGRCAIHAEIGLDALGEVCKLYPRGLRKEPDYECSCANSCEATLELLFSKDETIKFVKNQLDIVAPSNLKRLVKFETQGKEQEIRLWIIDILQNREFPLPQRLMNLGLALNDLKTVLDSKDVNQINNLIEKSYEIKNVNFNINKDHLLSGLTIIKELLKLIDEKSNSVKSYGEEALKLFNNNSTFETYEKAKTIFETKIPKWEIWFEHMLVNHMFFEQFPFQDRPEGPWEEFVSICAIYAILRFLSIGWMSNKANISDFVDMSAALFRLIDHTVFDRYASYTLRKLGCDTPQKIFSLIML